MDNLSINNPKPSDQMKEEVQYINSVHSPDSATRSQQRPTLGQPSKDNNTDADLATTLLSLPAEILQQILTEIFGFPQMRIDVLWRWRQGENTERSKRLLYGFPKALAVMKGLLGASSYLRQQAKACIVHNSRFECNTNDVMDLPFAFKEIWCEKIGHLNLNCHRHFKQYHRGVAPMLIDMLGKKLPNLSQLSLWTLHNVSDAAYYFSTLGDPHGSVSRADQDRRTLLKFASFLVLRSDLFNRVILPATSGRTWEDGESSVMTSVIVDRGRFEVAGDYTRTWDGLWKLKDATSTRREFREDEIINATAVRRIPNIDLANTPIDDLIIRPERAQHKDEIWSSEVPMPHDTFALVDERGYLTDIEEAVKGIKRRSPDELIKICEIMGSQSNPETLRERELIIENIGFQFELDESGDMLKEQTARIDDMQTQMDDVQRQLFDTERDLQDRDSELREATESNARLRDDLDYYRGRWSRAVGSLDAMSWKLSYARQEVTRLKNPMGSAVEHSELEATLGALSILEEAWDGDEGADGGGQSTASGMVVGWNDNEE